MSNMETELLSHHANLSIHDHGPISLDVQVLTNTETLRSLEPEWNPLLGKSASPNIFLTWEWIWNWLTAFGAGMKPWVLVARETQGGRLVGVAPFALRRHPIRHGPWRELVLIGTTTASGDHLDVLAQAGTEYAVAEAFARFLHLHWRLWDVLALDRMASASPLAALLWQQQKQPAMQWHTVCPLLQLPRRWEDCLTMLGHRTRHNVRHRADRLWRETQGAVQCQLVRSRDDVPAAMEEFFRLHAARWKVRGQPGAFHDAATRSFHHRVALQFFDNGWLRLYLIRVRAETIAALYCFRYGDTVSFYQSGYEPKWAPYSPGEIIIANGIRGSIEEGAREFDFLRGEEAYKSHWTRVARWDQRLRLASTARGSALVMAYRAYYAARKRYRQWRGRTASEDRAVFELPPVVETLATPSADGSLEGTFV